MTSNEAVCEIYGIALELVKKVSDSKAFFIKCQCGNEFLMRDDEDYFECSGCKHKWKLELRR